MDNHLSKLPVQNQNMSKKNFLRCYLFYGCLLALSLIIGFIQPIPIYLERVPSDNLGTSLDLHNSKCTVDIYGRSTSITSCWHHYFKFRHIWTQYFALDAVFNVDDSDESIGITEPVQLKVTWQGRTNMKNQCNVDNVCTDCINDWREKTLKRLNPLFYSNVAKSCMPQSCGNCNLRCYLCLRNVNADDNSCRIQGTQKINATTVCTDAYEEGASKWNTIATKNQSMTRTITCPRNSKKCLPSILFKTSHVEYRYGYRT